MHLSQLLQNIPNRTYTDVNDVVKALEATKLWIKEIFFWVLQDGLTKNVEGPFYDKGEKRKLRAYAQIFGTAEIDSTFYRVPSKGMVFGWLRYTPLISYSQPS